MIAYLKGTLAAASAYSCVLDVNGVGYELLMSSKSLACLPSIACECMLYTFLQVKDDGLTMFGFKDMSEKEMFVRLINVSGIGPKIALAALSSYTPAELSGIIAQGDVAAVCRVPGIGKKTAQRVILELQGILKSDEGEVAAQAPSSSSSSLKDATAALLGMGFSGDEVSAAFAGLNTDGREAAELVRIALRNLGGR